MTPTDTKAQRLAAWRKQNPDKVAAQIKRSNDNRRKDPEKWARKLEHNRLSAKRHRAKRRVYYQARRSSLKQRASGIIRCRIYRGTLKRLPCQVCGNPKSHAHHSDYTKPLEVQWLCPTHHAEKHHVR